MVQSTSLVSMLGAQTQLKPALPLPQAIPGFAPSGGVPSPGIERELIESLDQNGSLFQLMLSFMMPGKAAQTSVSPLQHETQEGGGAGSKSLEGSITLPFPVRDGEAAASGEQNASVSAMMPFAPFMFTPMPQRSGLAPTASAEASAPESIAPGHQSGSGNAVSAITGELTSVTPMNPAFQIVNNEISSAAASATPQQTAEAAKTKTTPAIVAPANRDVPVQRVASPDLNGVAAPTAFSTIPGISALQNQQMRTPEIAAQTENTIAVPQKSEVKQAPDALTVPTPGQKEMPAVNLQSKATGNASRAQSESAPGMSQSDAQSHQTILSNETTVLDRPATEPSKAAADARLVPSHEQPAVFSAAAGDRAAETVNEQSSLNENQSLLEKQPSAAQPEVRTGKKNAADVTSSAPANDNAHAPKIGERASVVDFSSASNRAADETVGVRGERARTVASAKKDDASDVKVQAEAAPSAERMPSAFENTMVRTPEIFTRLHESIAQTSESLLPKNSPKPAAVQSSRTSVKSTGAETLPEAGALPADSGALQTAQVPAESARARASANDVTLAASTKAAHDAVSAAAVQHPETSAPDSFRGLKPEMTVQHPAGITNEMQPHASMAAGLESARGLSPRVKDDVFERVFKEVSSIKHTPSSVNVTLSPESLGKVTVNVGVEEGKMAARINVQNTDVKQMMEAALPKLQEALQANGLTIDSIAVFVNNGSSFSERRNDAPKRKMSGGQSSADDTLEALGSLGDAKQYGYSTVEYIM